MKQVKYFLLRILGRKNYLKLTSRIFLLYYRLGWLKNDSAYFTHYFVRHFIKPGHTVLDIGANLGYYSCQFAQWVGKNGAVMAVEPVPLYREVLKSNTRQYPQVQILPYALAEKEGVATMGIPGEDKHRHGLMRMLTPEEKNQVTNTEEVQMKHPLELFGHLRTIDYIKCDIEGYEVPVLPLMWSLIETKRPIIQVETDGENKTILFSKFLESRYQLFYVHAKKLQIYASPDLELPADMIAIPEEKIIDYQIFIENVKS